MKTKFDCRFLPMSHNFGNTDKMEELAKDILGLIRPSINERVATKFFTPREVVMEAERERGPYTYTLRVYVTGNNPHTSCSQKIGTWEFEFDEDSIYLVEI